MHDLKYYMYCRPYIDCLTYTITTGTSHNFLFSLSACKQYYSIVILTLMHVPYTTYIARPIYAYKLVTETLAFAPLPCFIHSFVGKIP